MSQNFFFIGILVKIWLNVCTYVVYTMHALLAVLLQEKGKIKRVKITSFNSI